MNELTSYRVQDVRSYRLRILRAAGLFGMVLALFSFGSAIRISDLPMSIASFLAGIVSLGLFGTCSRKLHSTNQ